jgi:hypothetical protein
VTLAPASQLRRSDRRSCPTSPGRPAFREHRYRRRGRSESSRQSGLTGHAAQAAMMPAAWSRALCTFSAIGNHSSGSTRGLAHRACRYTRPASSLSVRSPGAQCPRGCAIISTGCTSYHAAVFRFPACASSSSRCRRGRIPRPVSRSGLLQAGPRGRGSEGPPYRPWPDGQLAQPDDHSASKHQMDPTRTAARLLIRPPPRRPPR